MRKLYRYNGTLSSYGKDGKRALDIILHDFSDRDKAPTRIEAFGGLADYIDAIEWTDAEERYLNWNWYYDDNLFLYRIEVPSTDPHRPAKIIAQVDPMDDTAAIFGPSDYIETDKPKPMSDEQFLAFLNFRQFMA